MIKNLYGVKLLLIGVLPFLIIQNSLCAQHSIHKVDIIGEMRNVMWKGQLSGVIDLDTLRRKEHLYGLGPLAYLEGEILVMDGVAYQSRIMSDATMKVEKTFNIEAPFFGYAHITKWQQKLLPDSVLTILQLEVYLDQLTQSRTEAFLFKIKGTIDSALIHVVNLPKGAKVSNPDEAHSGNVNYPIADKEVEILGFFSRNHQAIFTHHDTYLHMHLITEDRKMMGHLDAILLKKGGMIFLPFN